MNMNFKNESGFTLLEALISFMVTGSIMMLLIGGLLQIKTINSYIVDNSQKSTESPNRVEGDRQIEWHLFLNQLENDLKGTVNVKEYRTYFYAYSRDEETNFLEKIEYRRPINGDSRRNFIRLKNNGNVRMLSGVQLPEFERDGNWLVLDFSFKNGESYTGRIWVENWKEKNDT